MEFAHQAPRTKQKGDDTLQTSNITVNWYSNNSDVHSHPLHSELTQSMQTNTAFTFTGTSKSNQGNEMWPKNEQQHNLPARCKEGTRHSPAIICWPTVKCAPGASRRRASICPLAVNKTALKTATVASGAPMPLYNPLGPSAAKVCFTASMAPAYLGGCPGSGAGCDCSFTLMVSKGCPTRSWATPANVPAVKSFATASDILGRFP
jgi:hypothetical protein